MYFKDETIKGYFINYAKDVPDPTKIIYSYECIAHMNRCSDVIDHESICMTLSVENDNANIHTMRIKYDIRMEECMSAKLT